MIRRSIHAGLGAIFLGFLLLVGGSTALTFRLAQTQQADATLINLAGRQRMLTQQMARLALTGPDEASLAPAIRRFEQTLALLLAGGDWSDESGRVVTLLPADDPAIQAQLLAINPVWDRFRQRLPLPADADALSADAEALVALLDDLVRAYEDQAQARVRRLQQLQLAFVTLALLLLAWGYTATRRWLIRPVSLLTQAARDIGAGRWRQSVPSLSGQEFGQLSHTMEAMRAEIAASHQVLDERVAQRTQELTTAFEFSQEIVRQLEMPQLLQSVAHRARDLMAGQAASVCILDESGQTLELVASTLTADSPLGLRQSVDRELAVPVLRQCQTTVAETGWANCGFLRHFPGAPCVAAPLQVGGRSSGALCVVRPQRAFAASETRALTLLANTAAIALENSRLVAAGRRQAEENASLAERERLAADLHDNLAQSLGALNLSLSGIPDQLTTGEIDTVISQLEAMEENVRQAYTRVRLALSGLQEIVVDDGEFLQRLRGCLDEFSQQSGLPVAFTPAGFSGVDLPAGSQKQVLHIVREALTNTGRHARASQVQFDLITANGSVQIVVSDDGIGFDPDRLFGQNHLGLQIMRARAERSGGELDIQSAPGEGTRVRLTYPQTTPVPAPVRTSESDQ